MTSSSQLPEVGLCLASSLDGRISATAKGAPDFTSPLDRRKLFALRAEADILLVGAGTVRGELLPPLVRDPRLQARRRAAGKPDHPAVAIASRSLDLPWRSDYFAKREQEMWLLSPPLDPVQRAQADALDLRWADTGSEGLLRPGLAALKQAGFSRVLAEGGGGLTRALLAEGLADRLYLTLAPLAIGGRDTPLLCDGPRLTPPAWFELVSNERVGDELHLEYWRK